MSEAKLANLLKKLHYATRSQRLNWHRRQKREGGYETTFSVFIARIVEHRISRDDFEHVVTVCDKQGVVIEEITELRFNRPEPANEMRTYLREIYNCAVRQSATSDEASDSNLDEL